MKFQVFTVALISALASARVSRDSKTSGFTSKSRGSSDGSVLTKNAQATRDLENFLNWASKESKSYGNNDELRSRKSAWLKVDKRVQEVNAEADASGDPNAKRLGHNKFSDRTLAEKKRLSGFKVSDDSRSKNRDLSVRSEGRKLADTANNVDWAAAGYTGSVKSQGDCGSCYSFAANSALEARIMDLTGEPYQRLSEQQLVDCSNYDVTFYYYNYGCNGGNMSESWWYYMDEGAMTDQEYPYYSGSTGQVGSCAVDSSKFVAQVDTWGDVDANSDALISALQERVLTVAVAADNEDWYQYQSGILTISDCQGDLDHAVTLVGYDDGTGGDDQVDPDDDDDQVDPDDDADDDDGADGDDSNGTHGMDMVVTETVSTTCRRQRWSDKALASGCRDDNEKVVEGRFCCKETITLTEDRLQSSGTAYWKIQNSWGADWGEDGFIRLAVTDEGYGVCGMNQYAQWVQPEI